MGFDIDGLLDLWSRPHTPGPEAEAAFAAFYTDPVVVNGAPLPLAALVERAVAVRATFADAEREVLDVCETGDKVAVAFRMRGRHTGPLATSAGTLPATGGWLDLRVIDVLTLTGGRVSSLWMVADELGALAALDAVALRTPEVSRPGR